MSRQPLYLDGEDILNRAYLCFSRGDHDLGWGMLCALLQHDACPYSAVRLVVEQAAEKGFIPGNAPPETAEGFLEKYQASK